MGAAILDGEQVLADLENEELHAGLSKIDDGSVIRAEKLAQRA